MQVHWFLPTAGDSRDIVGGGQAASAVDARRPPDLAYLTVLATAVERLGFAGVLTPTGTFCEDAWLTTAALIGATRRLRFLVAFRPGLLSPTLAAQMAATYQRLSGGRLLLNVVTGGDSAEQRRFGDHLGHDERYARTAEFLTVLRGAWSGTPFTFTGAHYAVEDATVRAAPSPAPPVFFGGSSPAALAVAGAHADTYLTWGEPPDAVAAKLAAVRELAGGRDLTFGIRLHVLSRDTAAEAWAAARALLGRVPPAAVAADRAGFAASESEGQRRMAALTTGEDLEIAPNLWAGYGLVRPGAGTALVGSHAEVADRLAEYHALGIDHVILSGQPHLEEAYHCGEGVLPLLRDRGLLKEENA
ncbi:LLM class flavin-dependent oxidoreductase [Spirilliplanes yamanashiensis]|uniref:Alkanesulfonate monooxygenase n=1 Tax=Spirilliplanes yamanashiensis TaxID=42233 RepID=A0A8J3Y5N5_9ACTN|nr:LLM class flavin-dependent oxidoreductase [Spirilliplanes yamanashiensis]MDP9819177.1 alkanesulfonate monooxygenase [Spirilliplanes yamanashiensis]GIJ02000.1 alkanesulfonate monooxygenase [Spirilliplanes yamanashiensis]